MYKKKDTMFLAKFFRVIRVVCFTMLKIQKIRKQVKIKNRSRNRIIAGIEIETRNKNARRGNRTHVLDGIWVKLQTRTKGRVAHVRIQIMPPIGSN